MIFENEKFAARACSQIHRFFWIGPDIVTMLSTSFANISESLKNFRNGQYHDWGEALFGLNNGPCTSFTTLSMQSSFFVVYDCSVLSASAKYEFYFCGENPDETEHFCRPQKPAYPTMTSLQDLTKPNALYHHLCRKHQHNFIKILS